VTALLSCHADKLTDDGHQRLVRHGHLPEREMMTGIVVHEASCEEGYLRALITLRLLSRVNPKTGAQSGKHCGPRVSTPTPSLRRSLTTRCRRSGLTGKGAVRPNPEPGTLRRRWLG
jgi:hypothetical protein